MGLGASSFFALSFSFPLPASSPFSRAVGAGVEWAREEGGERRLSSSLSAMIAAASLLGLELGLRFSLGLELGLVLEFGLVTRL